MQRRQDGPIAQRHESWACDVAAEQAVGVPFGSASLLLHLDPGSLVVADALEGAAHVEFAGFRLSRRAVVDVGVAVDASDRSVSVTVRCAPADDHGLLPVIDGVLVIEQLTVQPPRTRVTFRGTYGPSAGVDDVVGDAVVGHALAERAADDLVRGVVDRLLVLAAPV